MHIISYKVQQSFILQTSIYQLVTLRSIPIYEPELLPSTHSGTRTSAVHTQQHRSFRRPQQRHRSFRRPHTAAPELPPSTHSGTRTSAVHNSGTGASAVHTQRHRNFRRPHTAAPELLPSTTAAPELPPSTTAARLTRVSSGPCVACSDDLHNLEYWNAYTSNTKKSKTYSHYTFNSNGTASSRLSHPEI